MQFGNTGNSYGFVARALHWLTALIIFAAFPLGILANGQDLTTDEGIRQAFLLFSIHKTTGVLAFTLGIIRLCWTLSQLRPAPIHEDRRVENIVASSVHWMLTIALIAVPLTGWLSHSATSELAPIWWPFGQSLPFVPKDAALAEGFGAMHQLFTKVLLAAVALHMAGALKHVLIDQDQVFARMWRGTAFGPLHQKGLISPALAALLIWATALTAGLVFDLGQTTQTVAETKEWPLADADILLVDGAGELIGTATAFGFLLVIDPDSPNFKKGTLDVTVPLDALEGHADNFVTIDAPFPLLQFLGTVQGTPPTLSATGPLTAGNQSEHAEFEFVIEPKGARITGTLAVPGLPDAFLYIDALALRP